MTIISFHRATSLSLPGPGCGESREYKEKGLQREDLGECIADKGEMRLYVRVYAFNCISLSVIYHDSFPILLNYSFCTRVLF